MNQDPLNVLWVEPHFPGRLGAVADWLVRRRGYRSWFYCHTADAREHWPASVGQGLNVQIFGVGGVAKEPAVAWFRTLERGLCYAFGCWEVVEAKRPRPIDLVVGRSCGLGSTLFVPVYAPGARLVNLFDYHYHPRLSDLAEETRAGSPPTYTHWRRSAGAMDLLELEQCDLPWTPTHWQRHLFPAEYRDDLWVQHDGVDAPRSVESSPNRDHTSRRSIAGRTVPAGTRVVTFVARSLERLRGFDVFWQAAAGLLAARANVICVIVGDPVVLRGLDIAFHNQDYLKHLRATSPPVDDERLWLLGRAAPGVVAEALHASDLHLALGRPYPVARSVLEAMGHECVVLASDTQPHREIISHGQTGLLAAATDPEAIIRQALPVLDDPAAHRSLGQAAAELIRERYARDVCLPNIAERFSSLASSGRRG
jgi:glycosyltransferase involved in cell wall biosynthesis